MVQLMPLSSGDKTRPPDVDSMDTRRYIMVQLRPPSSHDKTRSPYHMQTAWTKADIMVQLMPPSSHDKTRSPYHMQTAWTKADISWCSLGHCLLVLKPDHQMQTERGQKEISWCSLCHCLLVIKPDHQMQTERGQKETSWCSLCHCLLVVKPDHQMQTAWTKGDMVQLCRPPSSPGGYSALPDVDGVRRLEQKLWCSFSHFLLEVAPDVNRVDVGDDHQHQQEHIDLKHHSKENTLQAKIIENKDDCQRSRKQIKSKHTRG